MPAYRRNRVDGGSYCFTVNLHDRRSDVLISEIALLRSAVRTARARYPFHIDAWVILPDQMHCLWTLPPGDVDFPVRWRSIKAAFSRGVPTPEHRRASMVRKREAGIWQRRHWEHTIRDDRDYVASRSGSTHVIGQCGRWAWLRRGSARDVRPCWWAESPPYASIPKTVIP